MSKITFATLKSLANKNKLFHLIHSEFDGMIDGTRDVDSPEIVQTTIEHLKRFRTHNDFISETNFDKIKYFRKFISESDDGYKPFCELYNCCYSIYFLTK